MKSKSNDKVCLNDNKSYVSKIALIVIIGLASFNLYYNNILINRSAFLFRDIKTDNKYGKFLLLHNSSINANFNVDKNIDIDDINIELGNFILVSHLINGYQNQAVKIANQLIEKKKIDTYAVSVLMFDYIRNKDWDKLISFIDSVKINKKNEQILILIKAWALVAKNDLKAGLKQLEQIKKFKGFEDIYFTHKAMMYEFSGDNLNAIEAYKESLDLKVSLRTVELLSKLYIRMDRVKSAIDTIDHYIATRPDSEMAKLFRAWLDNKNNIKNVKNNKMQITEGFAEAFFNLGFYNQLKKVDNLSLLFTCLSISVNPNLDFAKLTLANLLANGGKREDAIRIANMIDKNSYLYNSSIGYKAEILFSMEKYDEALKLYKWLIDGKTLNLNYYVNLAAVYEHKKEYKEALKIYDYIFSKISNTTDKMWVLYFNRAVVYDKMGKWDLAEKDLHQALDLSPDNAIILNYLGYSWVDKDINIEDGLQMIEKSTSMFPNNESFLDSLGWAIYKSAGEQKDIDLSIKFLELAKQLDSTNPTINDHLGDVYLKSGRVDEAIYSWEKAILYNKERPELKDIKKVQSKIDLYLNK